MFEHGGQPAAAVLKMQWIRSANPLHLCQHHQEAKQPSRVAHELMTLALQDAAGQMRKSPFSFSGIGPTSPLLWLAQRYAILDGFSVPIIAEGDEEPNDTYVEQLVAGAQAAVEVSI